MASYVPLTPVDGRGSRHSLQIVGVDTGPLNQIQGTPRYRATAADTMTTAQNMASVIRRAGDNVTKGLDELLFSERGGIKIDDSLRGVIESLIDGPFGGGLFVDPNDMFIPDLNSFRDLLLEGFKGIEDSDVMAAAGILLGIIGVVAAVAGGPVTTGAAAIGAAAGIGGGGASIAAGIASILSGRTGDGEGGGDTSGEGQSGGGGDDDDDDDDEGLNIVPREPPLPVDEMARLFEIGLGMLIALRLSR